MTFFLFNDLILLAQDTDDSQNMHSMETVPQDSMDPNSDLDYNQLPESDITTKIYRSTDNLNDSLDEPESGLEPALDADVINKEDLINMTSHSKKEIIRREKSNNEIDVKKSSGNVWLPWVLFAVILVSLTVLIKVIKRIKI